MSAALQLEARALGGATRYCLFRYIVEVSGPVAVGELTGYVRLNHNAVCQHLAVPKDTGLGTEEAEPRDRPGRPACSTACIRRWPNDWTVRVPTPGWPACSLRPSAVSRTRARPGCRMGTGAPPIGPGQAGPPGGVHAQALPVRGGRRRRSGHDLPAAPRPGRRAHRPGQTSCGTAGAQGSPPGRLPPDRAASAGDEAGRGLICAWAG